MNVVGEHVYHNASTLLMEVVTNGLNSSHFICYFLKTCSVLYDEFIGGLKDVFSFEYTHSHVIITQ